MDSPSPYRSHPIFGLRIALLANAAVAVILGTTTAMIHYVSFRSIYTLHIVLFCISGAVACYDFVQWAVNKSQGDESYQWPSKLVLGADFILAGIFVALYVVELGSVGRYIYRDSLPLVVIYTTISPLLGVSIHGVCVWKETRKIGSSWNIRQPWGGTTGHIRMEGGERSLSAEA